jgi:hypothetical protein
MEIKLKDFISILSGFEPDDSILFAGSSKVTIQISHSGGGFTQIQLRDEKGNVECRTVSTVNQHYPGNKA